MLVARLHSPLHDPYLLLGQFVELVHETVNFVVRGVDEPLNRGLFVSGPDGGELFVQVEHRGHERDHAVVTGDVGGGGKVNGADGNAGEKLTVG